MHKAVSVSQAQKIDHLAIQKFGIPSLILMENAGRETAQEILKLGSKKRRARVCIFCGTGNNGGDGFVVARHLFNAGINVRTFLIGKPQNLKQDPATYYQILKKIGCPVKSIRKVSTEVLKDLKKATVIVDAIFGIGLSRTIDEPFKSIINAMNQVKKDVISVDVPSGLDATTGKILGVCVKASCTVTFAVMKKGFLKNNGPRYAGKVIVSDIGIPRQAIDMILLKGRS
ncbi:MAG: NAD(P)H-hydrate epimerase [Candidatus Omnitrophota bacterium]